MSICSVDLGIYSENNTCSIMNNWSVIATLGDLTSNWGEVSNNHDTSSLYQVFWVGLRSKYYWETS